MQSSVLYRGARLVAGRPSARRRLLWLQKTVAPLNSVPASSQQEQDGREVAVRDVAANQHPTSGTDKDVSKADAPKEPDQQPEQLTEQSPEQQSSTSDSTTIDVESTPVVALVAQPNASSNAAPGEAGTQEPAQGGFTSHPIEDLPEEVEEDLIASKELVAEVMDSKAFGKRGEQWLFAQLAAIAMLMFPPLTLKGLVDFCATLSLTTGLVFMLTALVHLGRNLSPLPEPRKKHELVVSGIYGYVRHPMYGGLLLAAFGLAVLTRNETRLAICALLWWVLEGKVAVEERALSERYPEYAEYKAKVKKFFPFIY